MKGQYALIAALCVLLSGCGTTVAPISASRSPASCGSSPTIDYADHIHCLPSPSAQSIPRTPPPSVGAPTSVASRAVPSVVDGFREIASRRGGSVSQATIQAMGRLISAPAWTLTLGDWNGLIQASVPGWSRGPIAGPYATVYTLNGKWGSLPLHTGTVQVTTTAALQPNVTWTYEAVAPLNDTTPSSNQATAAARVLMAQLSSAATEAWSQGHHIIGMTSAAQLPAVTLAVANLSRNVLAVTVSDGHETWTMNGNSFLVLSPYLAPTVVVNWIEETL